jgi:hypothetical protein
VGPIRERSVWEESRPKRGRAVVHFLFFLISKFLFLF